MLLTNTCLNEVGNTRFLRRPWNYIYLIGNLFWNTALFVWYRILMALSLTQNHTKLFVECQCINNIVILRRIHTFKYKQFKISFRWSEKADTCWISSCACVKCRMASMHGFSRISVCQMLAVLYTGVHSLFLFIEITLNFPV